MTNTSKLAGLAAAVLFSLAAGCGAPESLPPDSGHVPDSGIPDAGAPNDGGSSMPPSIVSLIPVSGATGVPLNVSVSATFNLQMNAATINATTFTVTSVAGAVPGTVTYANSTAVFTPTADLAGNGVFTATITTGAKSISNVALTANRVWTFTTGTAAATTLPVALATSGNYVILAKSAVSNVPTSAITGNIGLSPAAASFITGFSLSADATNVFATSPQVTGKIYAADYAPPTPTNMTTAVGDMQLAFTDASGRAPGVTELGAGNIGGMTLAPGVYKWGTGLLIPTNLTLAGSATAVWIFQIAQNLTVSSAARVLLAGGALPKNIFWEVAGSVDLGTTSHFEGVVLSKTAITLRTGASINGRLLAQTAVALDGNTVVAPAP